MEFFIDLIKGEAILCEAQQCGGAGYTQHDREQVIPKSLEYGSRSYPVTEIVDSWANPGIFSPSISDIIFPKTIKHIRERAFANYCFVMDKLELPESLLSIGREAFWDKSMLLSYKCQFKEGRITENHFKYSVRECIPYIKTVVIGSNVTEIGNDAFPPNMEVICHSTFVERIEGNTFRSIKFTDDDGILLFKVIDPIKCEVAVCGMVNSEKFSEIVKVPKMVTFRGVDYTVTTIGQRAFTVDNTNMGCCCIENIELPDTLVAIEDEAFLDCYFQHIEVPCGVEYIGDNVWTDIVDIVIKLPKTLRYIGYCNLGKENCKFISDSPYINVKRKMILNDKGEDLMSVGEDALVFQIYNKYHYSEYFVVDRDIDMMRNSSRYKRVYIDMSGWNKFNV